LLPGDRFVVQGFARTAEGGTTLGGGTILDVAPAHRRPSDPALVRDLEILRDGARRDGLRIRIERSGLSGIALANLVRETGLTPSDARAEIAALEEEHRAVRAGDWCWAEAAVAEIARRIEVALAAFHRREPLRPGLPRAALAGDLPGNVRSEALLLALERLAAQGRVAVEADLVRLTEHRPELSGEDEDLAARLTQVLAEAALEPPTLKEWSEQLGLPAARVRELLIHLTRSGVVVQAPGEMFFDARAVEALRERVREYLKQHDALETPAYKDLISTTRKHAVPLMELFDAERLTLRVGNKRVLRGAAGRRDD
jgi:selenocysteine-specific elongation factor